jgi:hypothetical protein
MAVAQPPLQLLHEAIVEFDDRITVAIMGSKRRVSR